MKDTSVPGEFPYTKYNPDPGNWTCACPAYRDSRFLICKHLIQRCHPVMPRFFLEVTRNRTTPFWSHPSLVPLEEIDDESGISLPPMTPALSTPVEEWDSDSNSDQDFDDGPSEDLAATYAIQMETLASDLEDLASIVRHQVQVCEVRLLARAQQETARACRWHAAIRELERINNSRYAVRPSTWSHSGTMFVYTRPSKQ